MTQTDRLREYLSGLSQPAQALLTREFERAAEVGGEDARVAVFVLAELRKLAKPATETMWGDDQQRWLFRPVEPFLTDSPGAIRPGQIRRSSLKPIWQWLNRDGAPEAAKQFSRAISSSGGSASQSGLERAARSFQIAASQNIGAFLTTSPSADHKRNLTRLGSPTVIEDMAAIGSVLGSAELFDSFCSKLPLNWRNLADSQLASISSLLDSSGLNTPVFIPFVLSLILNRMFAPWQIIRLAVKAAHSDDETRVAATPYGIAVTMALHELQTVAANLRSDIKRAKFTHVADHMRTVHDGIRGLRTELDIRADSTWGKQLASLRADISNALKSEIESVPGRARRLLRQRPDREIAAASAIDTHEADETVAMIDLVATCRTYASELAINEVTVRTHSDLQQYVEQATQSLVASLRQCSGHVRAFRQQQVKVAIRCCEVLFGADYATLMSRSADNAMVDDRKAARAG